MQPPGIHKRIFITVTIATLVLLAFALVMGLKSTRQTRDLVTEQFNQQQLIIARNVSLLIERELDFLKKEIKLLSKDISAEPFEPTANLEIIQKSFHRVIESGVWRIEVADLHSRNSYRYLPYSRWSVTEDADDIQIKLPTSDQPAGSDAVISQPQIKPHGIILTLALPLAGDASKLLIFNVNVSWLLTPFLSSIRSGKTGYAWVIDQNGIFLFHPVSDFVGKNASEVRKEKDPSLSYNVINFIQQEKMLKGLEGVDWYISGWHRGIIGKVKKLIAYTPIAVSANPPQQWSVAVVAPVAEVEGALKKGALWQLLLQGFVLSVILLGAGTVLFVVLRWSRTLEKTVAQRTAELKKSEEKYRSLVESAEDFIFTVDADGRFQSMNSFTANFFGGWPEKFLGKPLNSLFPDEITEKQVKLVRQVFTLGKSARDEFKINLGETEIWLSANFMPIKNEAGETGSVLCIARDITESKNLENQLINAEKLASLGTLAAGVAHEVNNPLGVILGFCDILLRKTEKNSQNYEDLKTIERQGFHCKEVVENLLSFARFGEGDYEYSDLNHCLTEIIKVVRHNLEMNNIELITRFADNIPLVKGEFRQLQQVFLNLINNAVAAIENGGVLQIKTDFEKGSRKAVVQFQDDGIGIRPEDMDHIFEPFFTTKPEGAGTGLGLFVSYGIISKYGGSIDCVSATETNLGKKKGTLFTIKLLTKPREE
ncbi:MAG: ATP-binding protein [Desulfobacterales bacterium]|nr:ATP-binding protein [Desulfobacterales bacterium]